MHIASKWLEKGGINSKGILYHSVRVRPKVRDITLLYSTYIYNKNCIHTYILSELVFQLHQAHQYILFYPNSVLIHLRIHWRRPIVPPRYCGMRALLPKFPPFLQLLSVRTVCMKKLKYNAIESTDFNGSPKNWNDISRKNDMHGIGTYTCIKIKDTYIYIIVGLLLFFVPTHNLPWSTFVPASQVLILLSPTPATRGPCTAGYYRRAPDPPLKK